MVCIMMLTVPDVKVSGFCFKLIRAGVEADRAQAEPTTVFGSQDFVARPSRRTYQAEMARARAAGRARPEPGDLA
jgi:hypothetical protein